MNNISNGPEVEFLVFTQRAPGEEWRPHSDLWGGTTERDVVDLVGRTFMRPFKLVPLEAVNALLEVAPTRSGWPDA